MTRKQQGFQKLVYVFSDTKPRAGELKSLQCLFRESGAARFRPSEQFAWARRAHSPSAGRANSTQVVLSVWKMAATKIEQKALDLLRAFERAGKSVKRVAIEGRKIELELSSGEVGDEFDGINMRHGKT